MIPAGLYAAGSRSVTFPGPGQQGLTPAPGLPPGPAPTSAGHQADCDVMRRPLFLTPEPAA